MPTLSFAFLFRALSALLCREPFENISFSAASFVDVLLSSSCIPLACLLHVHAGGMQEDSKSYARKYAGTKHRRFGYDHKVKRDERFPICRNCEYLRRQMTKAAPDQAFKLCKRVASLNNCPAH
ncbi:MAG: hypothetical protein U1B83_05550 [Candidatus Cloacimonadaceae bacterium]|nr:hypothetical protein [Candidatus Cloacimonadaceae bacterium]